MPVWCGSYGLLKLVFPEIEEIDRNYLLSGFGKKPEIVPVYRIPKFLLTNGEETLIFKNLYTAASFDRNFGCDFILSATMFRHMDYSVLNRKRTSPILQIVYDRDEYYTQKIVEQSSPSFVRKIFSFVTED